jgi:hypothetical protein
MRASGDPSGGVGHLGRPFHNRLGDSGQIRGHDPPADPASEAVLPVVEAQVQALTLLQDADPPLDPGPKTEIPVGTNPPVRV